MKSKKWIGIVAGVIVVALAAVCVCAGMGLFRNFDAQKYVRGILNQTFQGDVEEAVLMVEGESEENLYEQYEAGIESFVENNITSGIDMGEELEEKYIALCKEIFKGMKYDVKEAEKVSQKEYRVPVEYQTADVFQKFVTSVAEESTRLMEKVEKGEYQGTLEEINLQMQQEYLNNSYELLNKAYQEVQYEEPETMVFTVKEDESGLYALEDDQIYEFITKIMALDEIQD